jgi:hypothetical protein
LPPVEQLDEMGVPFEDSFSMPESDPVKWAFSDILRLAKPPNQNIVDFSHSLRCYAQPYGEVEERHLTMVLFKRQLVNGGRTKIFSLFTFNWCRILLGLSRLFSDEVNPFSATGFSEASASSSMIRVEIIMQLLWH